MKIIQILPALKEGGVETGTVDLCLSLSKSGHDMTVISSGGPLVSKLEQAGVRHVTWPVHEKNIFTILSMIRRLHTLIKRESIDIIHARSRVPGWITFFACLGTQTDWVSTCHGYYRLHFGSRVMGWARRVIVASDAIRDHMVKDFGVPTQKIAFIPRGVDLERFTFHPKPSGPPVTLGMIGRLTPLKGHKIFIQSLAQLKKEGIPFRAHIIGEATNPHYLLTLKQEIQALSLTDEIHFLGHQSDIPQCLRDIDVLVLATTYPEAFGRVIIEAQASGVPVVATRVGGVTSIIEHNKTGLLCKPGDPTSLSDQLKQILLEKIETEQMVRQARRNVEQKFSKEEMIQKTMAVYEDLRHPKRILVFKLSALGDMVLISPSLRALRKAFPKAHISLLTDPLTTPLVQNIPYIDNVHYVSKKQRRLQFFRIVQQLKKETFDLSVDFQNTYWTHLITFLCGIPARCGYPRKWGWFCLNRPAISKPLPPVEHQFEVLKRIPVHPESTQLECWIPEADQRTIKDLLKTFGIATDRPLIGIHIGASWATKQWPVEYIANFCDVFQEDQKTQIILTGTEKDSPLEKQIFSLTKQKPFSAVGKTTLLQLAALIQQCDRFLTPDSLPLHLAAAVQTPTLALFGPTDPSRHVPTSANLRILNEKVDCGPCYRSTCSHHTCMVKLDPQRVIKTFDTL